MNSNSILITENASPYTLSNNSLNAATFLIEAWGGSGGSGGGQHSDGSAAIGGAGGSGGYAQTILTTMYGGYYQINIGTPGGEGTTTGAGGGGNGAGGGGGSTSVYNTSETYDASSVMLIAGGGGGGQCPDDGTQAGSPGQNGANGVVSGGVLTMSGNGGIGAASGFGQGGSAGTGGGGATGSNGANGYGGGGGGYTAGSNNGGGGGSFCATDGVVYSSLGQSDNPTVNGNGCVRISPLISTINMEVTIVAPGIPQDAAPIFFLNNLAVGSWSSDNFTTRSPLPVTQQGAVSTVQVCFFGYAMQQVILIELYDSAFPLRYQLTIGVDENGNVLANTTNPQGTGYQFSSAVSGSNVTFTFEAAS